VIEADTGQGAKILNASGKYMQRNYMVATHSWFYFYLIYILILFYILE
jgi:hypothetical protein